MGKVVSFVLAVSAIGLLALLVTGPNRDVLRTGGLILGVVALAILAWSVSFVPALARVPSTARAHFTLPPVDKRLAALRLKDRSAAA